MKQNKTAKMTGFFIIFFLTLTTLTCPLYGELLRGGEGQSFFTEASYFTYASCIKEGTSGICANGERLNDEALVCASWDFKLNSWVRVTRGNRSVICKVADRGPNRKLYKKGRRIDLSKKAMEILGGIQKGIIQVEVEPVGAPIPR